jgi:phage tail-like protein
MDKRGYVAGKYGLEVGKAAAGWILGASGGHATSDVVTERVGPDHIIHKHLAGVKYEDIVVKCGTGMSKGFYEWIKASFERKYIREDGAVCACDYNFKELSRLEFKNAMISEIGFPALDAASKDAAYMTVKIAADLTRRQPGSNQPVSSKYGSGKGVQKKWLPANFRLKIDGLDCTAVNKIESLVLKQKLVEHAVGQLRDYEHEPAYLEIPNLVITLAESHSKEFYEWHEDFVIKGNNGQDNEKKGTLEFLTPNLKETLFTITFTQMGIFKLGDETVETGSENIRRVKAELYVEDMAFAYSGGATFE